MFRNHPRWAAMATLLIVAGTFTFASEPKQEPTIKPVIAAPATAKEARDRSKLLHETIRGTLQVVHRDYFDEDDAFAIPSRSLEDVFYELSRNYQVQVKWLIIDTDVLNTDHLPENDFEKRAVESLAKGEPWIEQFSDTEFRYAGAIILRSQCLKCHVKRRNSNEDRTAGLVITMPIAAAGN
ncbi:c-type heme family protein [Rubripirellula amarantea]|nr:DUF3365 domain-containing protein [Rubripirellula amarantea]